MVFKLFKKKTKEEIEQEKKAKEKAELEKAYENNPLIQVKPLDPTFGKERHLAIVENMGAGLEKHYFWIVRFLKEKPWNGLGFENVEKIRDLFDASITSSFHGHVGTKLSALQQQAQQYMGLIGQMIKTIFPIIRELRITDERLEYYEQSLAGDESAEIALKSIWIEMVEQGMQNPNSVYALATKVGFMTLPDLFFSINPKNGLKGVDAVIKSSRKEGVNKKVADVLAKKLYSYYNWKDKTYKEMHYARDFKLKYLRQHYNATKMYMNWVRPYLKSIGQLTMAGSVGDTDLVNAFETSKINLEILAQKTLGYNNYFPCLLVKIKHITRPELMYTPQQQKQPIHVGRTEIVIEPYVATKAQIEAYKNEQDAEDVELFASMDATMATIKEDLQKYLREAGEKIEDEIKDKKKEKRESNNPFVALIKGFGEIFGLLKIEKRDKSFFGFKEMKESKKYEKEKKKAAAFAAEMAWTLYDVFKKTNGMNAPV
ncbi:MAG: hypothetical protein L6266_04585 [Nanoarchaeota archaeon]|nr:hypothetical protein [Nanoarchaeota archaeon]